MRTVAAQLELAPEVLATQRDLRRMAHGESPGEVLRGWRVGILAAPLAEELARG